jgi:hypothetical protein
MKNARSKTVLNKLSETGSLFSQLYKGTPAVLAALFLDQLHFDQIRIPP